jgi:predicted alpha/beta superfamily hydrolase
VIGDSSGGHFVLRALYDERSPFSRYVCISPSMGAAAGSIARAEAEYAATHDDLDAEVFVCCGRSELDYAAYAMARIGSAVVWTAEQFALRGWPSARLGWEIMRNEDHASVTPRAISAGLRFVHQMQPGVHDDNIAQWLASAARAAFSDDS